ncbi:transglycosylase domain-containing protein [Streptomyces sp. XD-27]|uniref:transglycosylase domain-containing protein n=1 Tax=Streptomyces sp. XD-27 TaxID=3062779 RepID=UPI0026F47C63|nr:transglycosylase domain-containing protein [Streptomyces sp. XD-27]WKX73299.1 transglycosylase domain-containing protein [Streptomyces sp. XD-27]
MRTRTRPQQDTTGEVDTTGEEGTAGEEETAGKKKRVRRTGIRRFFTWRKLLAYALSLWALLLGAFAVLYYCIDIPEANALAKAEANVYLYSDGTVAARTGEINRERVPISRVPKSVQRAFVAAENKSFYQDAGVDPMGIARGLVSTVTGGGTQGGSTITQQYVKNYYLSQEQTVTRKVKELVIALKVDQRSSKDEILAGYLNTSYFGRVAYGIQAAARAYYDKNVEELTVEEGAYLAALVQAPSQYDWAVAGPTAKRLVTQRWNYVLDNMVDMGWLDPDRRRGMRFPEPVAPKPAPGLGGQAGYLVEAARQELIAAGVGEQELAAGGWTITLSVDRDKQRSLERAVARQSRDDGEETSRTDGGGGSSRTDEGGGTSRTAEADTQTGAVSVDPRTGRVLALYGGRDYTRHYISNATRSDYQAGTAFEPIALAGRLEHGADTAVGPAEIRKTAEALGMDPDASGFTVPEATTLGLMGTSPLDLAGAYATLDHQGRKVTPTIVASARRGETAVNLPDAIGGQAVQRETADKVTAFLADPRGQGTKEPVWLGTVPQAVAAKSGRSDDRNAAWFVGYTPQLVTVVGQFGEDAKSRKQVRLKGAGGGRVERIWSAYMGEALRDAEPAGFEFFPQPRPFP